MVTLSNVAIYQKIKNKEITYLLPEGFTAEDIETGALGLSVGRILNGKYEELERQLWEGGTGYPINPFEEIFIESLETVGTNNIELEFSGVSSLARLHVKMNTSDGNTIGPQTTPKRLRILLKNGPIGLYFTKGLPFGKLRPHLLDEEKYMTREEILDANKSGGIQLLEDREVDFKKFGEIEDIIEAYTTGDPWRPEKPVSILKYLDKEDGLTLPINTAGILKLQPTREKFTVLDEHLYGYYSGHEDFILAVPDKQGRVKIEKNQFYLANTKLLLGLHGIVGEVEDVSQSQPNVWMHATSKLLDSDNVNAPVCEIYSDGYVTISPRDTVCIKFEKIDGVISDNHKNGAFSFQRFPKLPRWYQDSQLLANLLPLRYGIRGHPKEKEIYIWLRNHLRSPSHELSDEEETEYWKNRDIAQRIVNDIFPASMDIKDKVKLMSDLIDNL
jgi:hypothetical protein